MKRIACLLIALSVWSIAGAAAPAHASCADDPTIQQSLSDARMAFVGTVVQTTNLERNATVRVEKIWLGPALPREVEVHGGPQGADSASSVDRTYRSGERYLFVLRDQEPPLEDNSCSGTTLYTPKIAELEPDGALDPLGATGDGPSLGPWIVVAAVLFGAGMLQARRAMRRAHSMDPGPTA